MTDTPEISVEPTTPYSLLDKRQEYADWLASGRQTDRPSPLVTRHDVVETGRGLSPPNVGTINELPPGSIVRTDEGDGDVTEGSEDVRLRLAGALADKAKDASPEQAVLIANAGHALLAPLKVRTDDTVKADGTNVKNQVLGDDDDDDDKGKKDDDDDDDDDEKELTLADVMKAIDGFSKRLDKLEGGKKKGRDGSLELNEPKGKDRKAADSDQDRLLAARVRIMRDSNAIRVDSLFREDATSAYHEGMNGINQLPHVPETQDFFAAAQARADAVYSKLGKSAPRPMDGEKFGNYRRRLLVPLQGFCNVFKHTDLKVVAVDNASLEPVERSIYTAAADEAINPKSVPIGTLREIVESRGGHTYAKFYGNPKSWMNQFAPRGKKVTQIIQRGDGQERVLYRGH